MVNIIKIIFAFLNIIDSSIMLEELHDLGRKQLKQYLSLYLRRLDELVNIQCSIPTRSCWMKVRGQSFWELECQLNSAAFFKSNFRMSRSSFEKLCKMLKGLEKKDTNFRKAVSLEKRVAIALYTLGSSAEYRTVSNVFGVGKTTVYEILMEFCHETWKCLWPLYMQNFPLTEEKLAEYTRGFECLGFPQVLGAIDGCHIEIHPAAEDAVDYHNYKGWYSTVLLALVDARSRFIYINVGSPGRCNDSSIFESSSLKRELLQCPLMKNVTKLITDVNVPVVLLGDSAFKFNEHLMKPYPFALNQPNREKIFNYNLSKCRRVVENAFGHLKARFRRVGKGIDNKIVNANLIIKTCCVLHNFLNEENDSVNEKWVAAQQALDNARPIPENSHPVERNVSPQAEHIRVAFTNYFEERAELEAPEVETPEEHGLGSGALSCTMLT